MPHGPCEWSPHLARFVRTLSLSQGDIGGFDRLSQCELRKSSLRLTPARTERAGIKSTAEFDDVTDAIGLCLRQMAGVAARQPGC